MPDFVEVDFLEAGDSGSGDAIAVRHRQNGLDWIYVVDGGYKDDGQKLVDHVARYYGAPFQIDHVVLTHPDADHASGLDTLMTSCTVRDLWMNRPWAHVDDLMPMFERYQDRNRLVARLKHDFPKIAELEVLASQRGIRLHDAFSGSRIGAFTVLSPSKATYLQLVVASDKTPVPAKRFMALLESFSAATWGEENLKGDTEGTSAENETSVVQFADVCGKKVLLTGDAGVRALTEAHDAAVAMGARTAGLDWFQVPHHGSRRNLSSEVLDTWLGGKLSAEDPSPSVCAIISANQSDKEHPKRAVVRGLIHRGRRVVQTAGTLCVSSPAAPKRPGWSAAPALSYPTTQEE